MRRRDLISAIVGSAAVWPLAARTQPSPRLPTIGFIGAGTQAAWNHWTDAFLKRLRELGWADGRTVIIDYRWADGQRERLPGIAAEFVKLKVDVIFAPVTLAALAARDATTTIPIVFALVGEPVAVGLIASLARPGGNVTGTSNQSTDLGSKRLEILKEVVPNLRRLAILVNIGNPANTIEVDRVHAIAQTLGIGVTTLEVRQPSDIASGLEALRGRADALYVAPDALIISNMARINTFVQDARLPTIHGSREYVVAGGLLSYGPTNLDQFRLAAEYVDNILRGRMPADLPVAQPTRFQLAINLRTAKALGISVPPMLLARADEVIE